MDNGINILGIDPGTESIGLSLVHYARSGAPSVLLTHEIRQQTPPYAAHLDTDTQLFERLHKARYELLWWLDNCTGADLVLDRVACERPQAIPMKSNEGLLWANRPATIAVQYAVSALLTLSPFKGLPRMLLSPQTCAAVFKGNKLPSDARKRAAVAWANQTYGLDLRLEKGAKGNAEADALVVAEAGYRRWREEQIATLGEIKPLFGKGSGTPRKAKVTA